jgi:hypothetical protein
MTPNDIDVSLEFLLNTGQVVVVDDTDYSGLTVSGTTGSLLLQTQGQFVFQVNTPNLVNVLASPPESAPYALPVSGSGCPLSGTYELTYNVTLDYTDTAPITDISATDPAQITLTGEFDYLEAGDEIVFSDMTVPELDGTYTIATVEIVGGDTVITLVEAFAGAGATGTADWSFERVLTTTRNVVFTACDKKVADLSLLFSCSQGNTTLTDITDIGDHTLVSRTLRLTYPPEANPAPLVNPITTSNPIISVSTLYEGAPYTGFVSLDLSYNLTGGGVAIYTTTATIVKTASCSLDLCCIEDCYEKLLNKYAGCNGKGNEAYENKLVTASALINQFNIQKDCGDIDGAAATRKRLSDLLGGDCSCGCGDEIVRGWVTPTDSGFQVSQGFMRTLFYNVNRITGTGAPANSFTNNPGFITPSDFNVGDCIEIEIRAIAIGAGADVVIENTTTSDQYINFPFASSEDIHLKVRIVRTATNTVAIIWNYVTYDSNADTVDVANGSSTYPFNSGQQNTISWVPSVPADTLYYWVSVVHISLP